MHFSFCSVCCKMLLNFWCLTFKLRISMHKFWSYPVWASWGRLSTETPFCFFSCCNRTSFFPYLPHPSAPVRYKIDWLTLSPHIWWCLEPRCTWFLLFVLAQYHGRLNYAFWVCLENVKKKKKALHISSEELYMTLQMCKKMLSVAVFIFHSNSYGFSQQSSKTVQEAEEVGLRCFTVRVNHF